MGHQTAAMVFVTGLTAAAAQLSVPLPFTAVPFTLQPMMVLLAGLVLGSKLALGSQLLYLLVRRDRTSCVRALAAVPPGCAAADWPTGGYLMRIPDRRVGRWPPWRSEDSVFDTSPHFWRCWRDCSSFMDSELSGWRSSHKASSRHLP